MLAPSTRERVNVASFLPQVAAAQPFAPAVWMPERRSRATGRSLYSHLHYRALDEDSAALARGLDRVGIGRGVRTVLMVRPSLDFFSLAFALFRVGAVPVLVD